ncbi:MAG: ATP-binding cassette domain-containing protein [Clostridiales bacterium]|jgi:oligopeptide/dipeptide ABC transporter ATP-binding protein|nr:ATP-binding cassette domain-containing protein [Clostridiales bacterium]
MSVRDVIVEARGLKKYFPNKKGLLQKTVSHVRAVDGVDLSIHRGGVVGIVGESGCGKSTIARLLTTLIPPTEGTVIFDGVDANSSDKAVKYAVRRRMNIVFQDPFSSLNPRMTAAEIVSEPIHAHGLAKSNRERIGRVAALMEQCGLFADQIYRYPHQFSGGQRQRLCIARALASSPEFIVCDEAVSALDVSIQAQIINLLMDLRERHGLTYVFISHDLNVVRFISDEVVVMYLGQIVEQAAKEDLFQNPLHPYTAALLSAVPDIGAAGANAEKKGIILQEDIPSPSAHPHGCRFHTRCQCAAPACGEHGNEPELREIAPGRHVRCHLAYCP